MAKAHDVNLYGYLQKDGTDLYGPLTQARINAVVNNMMAWRDSSKRDDFSIDQEGMYADILANAGDNYSPGIGGIEQVSMLDKIDGGNFWTVRGYPNYPTNQWVGSFGQGSDYGIIAGGYNASAGRHNKVERYQDSVDTWLATTDMSILRGSQGGTQLSSYRGIIFGGSNGANSGITATERWDNNDYTWTSRSNQNVGRAYNAGWELTNDLSISSCGYNLSGGVRAETERYSDSANTWTNRTNCTQAAEARSAASYTTDAGSVFGGNSGGHVATHYLFSDSVNTWTTKTSLNDARTEGEGSSQSSNSGFAMGGYSSPLGKYLAQIERYDVSKNNWINRTEAPDSMYTGGAWSFSATKIHSSHNSQAGGFPNAMRFKDSPVSLSFDGGLSVETYKHQTPAVPYDPDTYQRVILTDDVTDTTTQIKSLVVSTLYNQKDAVEMAGYWTLRNPINPPRNHAAAFSLTSDGGIYAGGWSGPVNTTTERFSESQNYWDARTGLNTPLGNNTGFEQTTDSGISACGHNGSSRRNNIERYNNSVNTWTNRTSVSDSKNDAGSFKLTSNLGILMGGYNASGGGINITERFSESGNSWTSRTNMNTTRYYPEGITLSEDLGIAVTGYGPSSWLDTVERYSDSENSWVYRSPVSEQKGNFGGFSTESHDGVVSGGFDNTYYKYKTERYTDVQNSWSVGTDLIITQKNADAFDLSGTDQGIVAGGHNGTYIDYVVRYTDSEPMSISFPTFDLTLDGDDNDEHTFPVRDQELNTIINLEDEYSTAKEYWSMRTAMTDVRQHFAAASLTSNLGISFDGTNASNYVEKGERYSDSENVWIARTGILRGQSAGSKLTSDYAYISGGNNGSRLANNDRFQDSSNSWTSRTALTYNRDDDDSFGLTTNIFVIAGGDNGSYPPPEQFSESGNSFTTKTANNDPRKNVASFDLSSDLGAIAGGHNGSYVSRAERYSESGNDWTNLPNLIQVRHQSSGTNIGTSTGMANGGLQPGSVYLSASEKYDDSASTWTSMLDMAIPRARPECFQLGTTSAISCGGYGLGAYQASAEKYMEESVSAIPAPSGVWSSRSSFTVPAYSQGGFGLTSDRAIACAGYNGSGRTGYTERYSNSADAWVGRSSITTIRMQGTDFPLAEKQGIYAGGTNSGSGYLATTDRYDDDTNSWSTRTSMNFVRQACQGFGLMSNDGLSGGGYNGSGYMSSTEQYSNGANTWTNKTSLNDVHSDTQGFELTTDTGIILLGSYSQRHFNTEKFSTSTNIWFLKSSPDGRGGGAAFTLGSDNGVIAGGSQGSSGNGILAKVDKYTDSSNIWSNLQSLPEAISSSAGASISSYMGMNICGSGASSGLTGTVQRFQDAEELTITGGGYWTSRADDVQDRHSHGAFGLDDDLAIAAAGNRSGGLPTTTSRHSLTANTWTSRTGITSVREYPISFGLTSNDGLLVGGNNGTNFLTVNEAYSDSGNNWTSKTADVIAHFEATGFGLDTDKGIGVGGNNSATTAQLLDNVRRYSWSGNDWTTRTAHHNGICRHAGIELTSTTGIITGGQMTTSAPYGESEVNKFDDTSNTWTLKGDLIRSVINHGAFGLSSTTGISCGGRYYDPTPAWQKYAYTYKFNETTNAWSQRGSINDLGGNVFNIEGFSFNSTTGMIAGGHNGLVRSSSNMYTDDVETPIVYGSAWTLRTPVGRPRTSGAGFELDTNEGIFAGGTNGSMLGTAERFSDTENTWTSRTDINEIANVRVGFGLTTDVGVVAGGENATQYINLVEAFTDSSNSWASRTALSEERGGAGAFTLTTNLGIVAGGTNNTRLDTVQRYSHSGNSWTSRGTLNQPTTHVGGMELTEDTGLICMGWDDNTTFSAKVEKYTDTGNSWSLRTGIGYNARLVDCFKLTSDGGITCGGYSQAGGYATNTEKYSDAANSWSAKLPFVELRYDGTHFSLSSATGISASGTKTGALRTGVVERYNDVATAEAFTPKYRLRLKFNLPRSIENAWTINGSVLDAKQQASGFGLSTTTSIMATGGNFSSSYSTNAERYDQVSKSAISRTDTGVPRNAGAGTELYTDSGIISGGHNGTDRIGSTIKFSDSSNIWVSRTSLSKPRNHIEGMSLSPNFALTCGGQNLYTTTLGETEKFSDSENSWTTRTNMSSTRHSGAVFSLSTNLGIYASGRSSTIQASDTTEMFTESSNSWSYRSDITTTKRTNWGGTELEANTGLCFAGERQTGSVREKSTVKFNNVGNTWIAKADLIIPRGQLVAVPSTKLSAAAVSGVNSSSLQSTVEKFIDSDTAFSGFAVQTFS